MEKKTTEKPIKVIAFGDVHGHTHNLLALVPQMEGSDSVIFLGDGVSTLEVLPKSINKKLYAVRGNTDFFCRLPDELLLEIGGARIFIAHGHTYDVKKVGPEEIAEAAFELGANLCLYGHTHKYEKKIKKGIKVINVPPLGTSRTKEGGSYLEVTITKQEIVTVVKKVGEGKK